MRFNLPSVLTPRYSQSSGLLPEESTNPTAHVTYLPSSDIPYTFNFDMRIEADVEKVESTTHKLSIAQSTDEEGFKLTTVTLAEQHQFHKDLVLTILPSHPHLPHAVVEPGSDKESNPPFLANPAVALNYFPDFSSAEAISELIFVIDRSGSMSGSFIAAAKETLMLFLKSIPDGCYFNIVGFGSRYSFLFKQSAPYDQTHLDQASDHCRAINADMGGTDILQPLHEIFKMPSIKGLPKQVFVLTDGAVSNTSSVIDAVRKNVHKARCFSVGIGSGASTSLVKGIAEAGRGSSVFVQSGEKMQPKVMQMLKRALSPSLSDVCVNWSLPDGVEVMQTPANVPPVFSGDRLVIYGLLSNVVASSTVKEYQATLQGVCGGNLFEHSIPFSVTPSRPGCKKTVHQLASRCIIHDLQDDKLTLEAQKMLTGLVSQGTRKAQESKKELIVELGVAANVVSQETAFVAVDEGSTEPVLGSMRVRQVPVATASGRGKCRDKHLRVSRSKGLDTSAVVSSKSRKKKLGGRLATSRVDECMDEGEFYENIDCSGIHEELLMFPEAAQKRQAPMIGGKISASASRKRSSVPQDTFSAIVSQQKASGAWQMNSTVANLVKKSVGDLEFLSPLGQQPSDLHTVIWATAVVIAWLELKCADSKDEWELLANKAKAWLGKQLLPEPLTCDAVLTVAKGLF